MPMPAGTGTRRPWTVTTRLSWKWTRSRSRPSGSIPIAWSRSGRYLVSGGHGAGSSERPSSPGEPLRPLGPGAGCRRRPGNAWVADVVAEVGTDVDTEVAPVVGPPVGSGPELVHPAPNATTSSAPNAAPERRWVIR